MKSVMALFKIQWKYDVELSVRKIYLYYKHMDPEMKNRLECIQRAHYQLMTQYILVGYNFSQMQ